MKLYVISMYILSMIGPLHAQQTAKRKNLTIQTKKPSPFPCEGMSKAEEVKAEAYSCAQVKKLQASAELILAAFKRDLKGIKKALEAGADINTRSEKYGFTPLMIQSMKPNSLQIVEFLLEQPGINVNAVDDTGATALHHAISYRNVKAIKLLLDHGALVKARDDERKINRIMQQEYKKKLLAESPKSESWLSYVGSYFSWLWS